jgi:proteasome alpha subunit
MSMPFYVSPEQLMKDRADLRPQGHRPRSFRHRRAVRRRRPVRLGEPLAGAAQGQRDLRPDRLRGRRSLQRVREPPDRRGAPRRHARLRLRPARRHRRGLANAYAQTLGTIFSSGGEKPYEVEIFVAEVGDARRGRPDLPADLRRPGRRRARLRRDGWGGRHSRRPTSRALRRRRLAGGDAPRRGRGPGAQRVRGPGDPGRRPRGRRPRPHPHPAREVPPAARDAARRDPRRTRRRAGRRRRHPTTRSPGPARGSPVRTTRPTPPTRSPGPRRPRGPGHRRAARGPPPTSPPVAPRSTPGRTPVAPPPPAPEPTQPPTPGAPRPPTEPGQV